MLAVAATSDVAPDVPQGQPDILVKTRQPVEVGVNQLDQWVMVDSQGLEIALPTRGIRFARSAAIAKAADLELARTIGLDRWLRVELADDVDATALRGLLAAMPQVEHAEVDVYGGLAGGFDDVDDPSFSQQWGLLNTGQVVQGVAGVPGADANILASWELSTGGDPIVIATLDSGAYAHQDLVGRVVAGWNVPQESSNTTDTCISHGTSVAGIIAANTNNSTGMAGICWTAQIMPIVVVDPCNGYESWVADGLVWAVDNGADIVNMSLQYEDGIQYLYDAVVYADSLDVPMISATGNYDSDISYPGKWEETIAVGATMNTDLRWSGSNAGLEIDLVAPGYNVYSTKLVSSYGFVTGTSFSCPAVAAVVAMMRAHDSSISSSDLRDIINSTARDIGLSGYDQWTGWGCLDAGAALETVLSMTVEGDLNGDGSVNGADITIIFSYWGECPSDCPADINGDGSVDGADLTILLSHWTF